MSDQTPGLPDFGDLFSGFARMQEARTAEFEGVAGGGAVRIKATGGMEFTAVEIDPEAVDSDDVGMLEDLVLAALHDLAATISDAQREAIGGFDVGGLGQTLGGLLGGTGGEPEPRD